MVRGKVCSMDVEKFLAKYWASVRRPVTRQDRLCHPYAPRHMKRYAGRRAAA